MEQTKNGNRRKKDTWALTGSATLSQVRVKCYPTEFTSIIVSERHKNKYTIHLGEIKIQVLSYWVHLCHCVRKTAQPPTIDPSPPPLHLLLCCILIYIFNPVVLLL